MWVCQMDGHGPATWAFYYFSEVITGSSWLIRGQKSVPVWDASVADSFGCCATTLASAKCI